MNRIVLIGNGFDLAHNLPTRYDQFINWYWDEWFLKLGDCHSRKICDKLCEYKIADYDWSCFLSQNRNITAKDLMILMRDNKQLFNFKICDFLKSITTSIETKGWVDIENEYYQMLIPLADAKVCEMTKDLNIQLKFLQDKLVEYLNNISLYDNIVNENIKSKVYEPFQIRDISISAQDKLEEHVGCWLSQDKGSWYHRLFQYSLDTTFLLNDILDDIKVCTSSKIIKNAEVLKRESAQTFLLPNKILLLNFNYTRTPELYLNNKSKITEIMYIHGQLSNPDSIIFGYGDELDDKYHEIKKLNNNEYLRHFKSSKYLESDNYRQLLKFIESEPYQIYIMGHSCGNSDRTLLNTLFEHDNCVSIKPYYYQKENCTDDYFDKIQNISRNFTDMKKMRDRVVNKTYCEPLPQIK